jgi:hypothetical protein
VLGRKGRCAARLAERVRSQEQTYELKYNMACALLEIPDFDKGAQRGRS